MLRLETILKQSKAHRAVIKGQCLCIHVLFLSKDISVYVTPVVHYKLFIRVYLTIIS